MPPYSVVVVNGDVIPASSGWSGGSIYGMHAADTVIYLVRFVKE